MSGGYPPSGPFPAGPPHERAPQTGAGIRPAGGGGFEAVSLAGQHPRAEERSPQRPVADGRGLDHRNLPESGPDVKAGGNVRPHGRRKREAIVAPDARTGRKQPGKGRQDAEHQSDHPV